jgi:GNAT superfamily N-acetyltransferase
VTTTETLAAQWERWAVAGNVALVSPSDDGTLVGVATLHQMVVLHRVKPVGRITALVVATPVRGRGIGRTLVAAAEEVLARAGCGLLEITSQYRHAEAHAFYARLGYEQTGVRFAKALGWAG